MLYGEFFVYKKMIFENCFSTGDEDIVVEALDVLQECVEMEQPLINDHIEVNQLNLLASLS